MDFGKPRVVKEKQPEGNEGRLKTREDTGQGAPLGKRVQDVDN